MLVDKDEHQRETIRKWTIWLSLRYCDFSTIEYAFYPTDESTTTQRQITIKTPPIGMYFLS